jgi:type 1 glutamine amidotransferase
MAKLKIANAYHPATSKLPSEWTRKDEWYNFRYTNPDINVLLTIDETSYTGGKNGAHHPMSWWHEFEGGRVFFTALGHTSESYTEPLFLDHLTGGILYAIGRKGKK